MLVAVNKLIPDRRPDLVLSGVNRGANLGEDVTYSGTIAAAMEATLLGIPAIALSQLRDGLNVHWQTAADHAPKVIRKLVSIAWPDGVLMNVNFPNLLSAEVKGIRVARQGRRPGGIEIVPTTDPVGRSYLWIGDYISDKSLESDTDLAATRARLHLGHPAAFGSHAYGDFQTPQEGVRVSLAARKIRLIMQLRQSGITDTRVLSAIERVPRELFVPAPFQDQAYENRALPIGHAQTLSQPEVVAIMSQALQIGPRHKVLEIGTGSGYQAAVLAMLCRRVYTIERHKPLLQEAEARLLSLRRHNITTRHGDGSAGWKEQAPFDRIMVTAAAAEVPQALLAQLAVGGILVVPVGPERGNQELIRVTRTETGYEHERVCDVRFVPLDLRCLAGDRVARIEPTSRKRARS